jgi:DNA-binding transcriptional MerR regulator
MKEKVEKNLLSIGEISSQTGINTVTLRAWERRYGLLKPQRTGKGHRLYTQNDLARIQQVQFWLNKGLAISKVHELLQNMDVLPDLLTQDSIWQQKTNEIKEYALELNRRKLDREIENVFLEYPVELVADQLLVPLLRKFNQAQYPREAVFEFFYSLITEQVHRLIYRQRQSANGKSCLIILSNPEEYQLYSLLLSYALLVNGFQTETLASVSPDNLVYVVNKLKVDFVVIIGFEKINQLRVNQYLQAITSQSQSLPVLLGNIANYWNSLEQSSIGFPTYQELLKFTQKALIDE